MNYLLHHTSPGGARRVVYAGIETITLLRAMLVTAIARRRTPGSSDHVERAALSIIEGA